MKLRHRRLAWSLTLSIAVLVILAALYLISLHYKVEKSFELHRAEIKILLEDIPVRSSSRPIVLGPAEEGNAWDLLRPALDAVGNLYPLESGLSYELRDANLDWRGVEGDTPRWIEVATPSLELCRPAMRRSTLAWFGGVDAG